MNNLIEDLEKKIKTFVIVDREHLKNFQSQFISRKSDIAKLFDQLRDLPKDKRAEIGKALNYLKRLAQKKYEEAERGLSLNQIDSNDSIDYSLPGYSSFIGSVHPVKKMLSSVKRVFERMGFDVALGPEIEKDEFNFTLLNFPHNHPARDMQDTLFIRKSSEHDDILLRTHTSPVQVRALLSRELPIRIISPGKVYRNETVSSRSLCVFHQVEGMYVDKDVNFSDLKGTLYSFVKQLFGDAVKIRFRPSFFPFTEVSAEMDISCYLCNHKGCRICKKSGWLEILGCGMVHPNVLRNCNVDPYVYSGFAFGMGIERIALLKYQLSDIRAFYENDFRLLSQFTK